MVRPNFQLYLLEKLASLVICPKSCYLPISIIFSSTLDNHLAKLSRYSKFLHFHKDIASITLEFGLI